MERHLYIWHFLSHRVGPESVAIFFVYGKRSQCIAWDVNPKFMGLLMMALIDRADNHIPFLQGEIDPPFEGWIIINVLSLCIFCDFDRV